jgi:hypothetical protein
MLWTKRRRLSNTREMPNWIYDLPDDAIIALMLVGAAGATAAALTATRYVVRLRPPREREGAIVDASRVVLSLTSLVLAF